MSFFLNARKGISKMEWVQVIAIVFPVMLAVIIGVIYNNRRLDDHRSDINQRFAEMNQTMNERFTQMNDTINQRFNDMNQRISDLKSETSEIRHLLIDILLKNEDVQKVADR